MDYKTMFIAYDLRNEAERIRLRATFEKDPALFASDNQKAGQLMDERKNLLTSAGLQWLV